MQSMSCWYQLTVCDIHSLTTRWQYSHSSYQEHLRRRILRRSGPLHLHPLSSLDGVTFLASFQEMKRLQELITQLNSELYNPVGLNILWPRKVAFLFVRDIPCLLFQLFLIACYLQSSNEVGNRVLRQWLCLNLSAWMLTLSMGINVSSDSQSSKTEFVHKLG